MEISTFSYPRLRGGHSLDNQLHSAHFSMHIHTDLEIIYIFKGNLSFQVEGSVYPMGPGDLIIARMAETHNVINQPNIPAYERAVFHVSPELLKETLNGRLLKPFLDRPLGVMNHYSAQELPGELIRACMQQIFFGNEMRSDMQALSYFLPVLQAVYDAYRRKVDTVPEEPLPVASQMIAYINRHLYELEGTHQLEEQFFLSASQINRIFHHFTGSSLWNYIRLKRLFAAREMLQSGSAPIVAATNCGYQDYSSFFRAYKKHFGHSPKVDYTPIRKETQMRHR